MPTSHAEGVRKEGAERVAHAFDLAKLHGVGGMQMLFQNGYGAVDGRQQKLVARQNRTRLGWGEERERVRRV